ncbi:twin-arginine translocase TatA/TatE family subunit [Tropicimonas sp. TH_r6]|uniref:twin-arginine translocase TatA/TatE family subunit n=1 Tax=Tropicimonas sp. TH_r6 TaxID=3082085 RepID=UPI002953DA8D|nr:twin-arginine translocase TatA/TatE family subunit [Tropicimonas sp. TH_r6]MDV7142077.1 twin-arginine translocase TatA/TatE family subunit [Tropicimonas sp. TH_r6]
MLNNIGPMGLLLIAVVVIVLFGRGKVSSLMGEVGKGITAFKKGVSEGKEEIEQEIEQEKVEAARDVTPEEEIETEKDKV